MGLWKNFAREFFYRDRQSRLAEFLFSTVFGAATIKVVQIIARTTVEIIFGDQLALRGSQHDLIAKHTRQRNKTSLQLIICRPTYRSSHSQKSLVLECLSCFVEWMNEVTDSTKNAESNISFLFGCRVQFSPLYGLWEIAERRVGCSQRYSLPVVPVNLIRVARNNNSGWMLGVGCGLTVHLKFIQVLDLI